MELRSPNFKSVKVVAPTGGLTAGQMYASNYLIGVILETVLVGEVAALVYQCDKIIVPKNVNTSCLFAIGAKVYYDASAGKVDIADTTTYVCIGRCTVAAAYTATTVEIDLHGDIAA